MSYTGFIADRGSVRGRQARRPEGRLLVIPASKADEYPRMCSSAAGRGDRRGGARPLHARLVRVPAVWPRPPDLRLVLHPRVLTVTVQLALQHRLDQDGRRPRRGSSSSWKICEPALGSGAFLNEAINQVAPEYLRRRQDELGTPSTRSGTRSNCRR